MMVGVFQVATLDQFKDLYASMLHQKKNSIPNVFLCSNDFGFNLLGSNHAFGSYQE